MKPLITIIILFLFSAIQAQSINQLDAKGQKQGAWKVTYENGKTKYEGTFKDNKPTGLMKRYFEDGSLKAEMYYYALTDKSHAKLYFDNGVLAGEGNYIGNQKDSTWNYYSYYTKTLSMTEIYVNTAKQGPTTRYYPNGKKAEITEWSNNQHHGKWLQYYENDQLHLDATYNKGKREGKYATYYPDGKTETIGTFANDLMEGDWIYYLPDGKEEMKVQYINGIAQNSEELKQKKQQLFELIEKNKGKIPEPEENNFLK